MIETTLSNGPKSLEDTPFFHLRTETDPTVSDRLCSFRTDSREERVMEVQTTY
jgi:hypothetical protein